MGSKAGVQNIAKTGSGNLQISSGANVQVESVTFNGGAMTGVTTLAIGGTLTGVTSLGMSGALTGVTTLAASSTVTLSTQNAITLNRGGTSKIQKTNSGNLEISSVASVKVESVTFNGGAMTGVTTLAMGGTLTGVTSLGMSGTLTGVTTIDQPDIRLAAWDTDNAQDVSTSNTVTKNGIAGRITWECQISGSPEFDASGGETKTLTVSNNIVVSTDMVIAWITRQNTDSMFMTVITRAVGTGSFTLMVRNLNGLCQSGREFTIGFRVYHRA